MKSAVETLNPTRVKLTVEVPFDELKPSLDRAYKTIGSQVQVPGFRKGHVPPRIIDQRIGRGAVIEEAVNAALPQFYAQAVEEGDLRPLGRPTVDVTEVPDAKGDGDLKFTVEVDVRPHLTLPDLDGIEVTVDDAVVTDEAVDKEVENLRERFGTLTPVERPAADGDFVTIDIRAEIDGVEIDSVKGVNYQIGAGGMLDGIDEALTDLSAGETTTFNAPLAGGERAGEEAQITVTVQNVKIRELPELDDDFAQLASEFDTLEELRSSLHEQAGRMKKFEQGLQARQRLLDHLVEVVQVPIPDGLVSEEVHRHLEGENRLEDDEHRAEVDAEARKALGAQLLLDTIAEHESVSVSQQELVEYLVSASRQYGMDPNTFVKTVDESGQLPAMVQEVARRKALAAVLSRSSVKDASGHVIDLAELLPAAREEQASAEEGVELPAPTGPATADPSALPTFAPLGFEPDLEPDAAPEAPASAARSTEA
ncbi:MAG TPA: trigger factor [Kineosporiaceae bacterium]